MLQVDPEHVSRVLSMARMARLHTLGLHHQKEDFRVVTQHNQKTTTNTMTKTSSNAKKNTMTMTTERGLQSVNTTKR